MSRNKERFLTHLVYLLLISSVAYAAIITGPLCYFVSTGVCSTVTLTNPLPVIIP